MDNFTLEATIALLLLVIYGGHTFVVISQHFNLRSNDSALSQKIDNLPAGNGWIFILVTVGLPFFCSLCAGWVANPPIIPANQTVVNILPSSLFSVAISIFILMITIEIGYLYDERVVKWRAYIIGALIIDIIALMCFLTIVGLPDKVITESAGVNSFFFGLVSLGSVISSCGTIYLCKLHSVVGEA